MSARPRRVTPELLDELPAADPRALESRRDLRRIHRAMGSVSILRRALAKLRLDPPPRKILELGAGDGSLLLRLAASLEPRWHDVELTLLDRQTLVSAATLAGYEALGWRVTTLQIDALEWAANPPHRAYDLCFANLFMHHFTGSALALLLDGIATAANACICCEPRRSTLAYLGSRLVSVLGANAVTREDAVKSVHAGFAGDELSPLWPGPLAEWQLAEYAALPFAHCFTAMRRPTTRAAA